MSTHFKMVISLSLGLLFLFGWHFATVLGLLGTAPETQAEFFIRIGFIIILFLFISVVTTILVARKDENAISPDEREEKIELRTDRMGMASLYIGLIIVMWFAFTPMTPMQIANSILAVACITEIIKISYGLFLLKRGI